MKDSTRTGHDAPAHERQPDPSPPLKHRDRARTRHSERHIDKQLEDTFPRATRPRPAASRASSRTRRPARTTRPWQDKRERGDA